MKLTGELAQRCGRFELDYGLLEQHPDVARRILSEVLVVRAEALYVRQAIEYHAYGEGFDPIGPSDDLPRYNIEVDQEADEVRWIRAAV